VWEGITFSAMDQYRKLWDKALGGGLPIIFNCMNNFYGMGGQPFGETMGVQFIARIGAGVNPEQMHSERVNGYDPLPVIDAFRRKRQILEEGRGPVLLDTITYRISGHSPSDASSYRSKEEVELWQHADSIQAFHRKMVEIGAVSGDVLDSAKRQSTRPFSNMFRLAYRLEPARAWGPAPTGRLGHVSNRKVEKFERPGSRVLAGPLAKSQGAKADQGQSAHGHAGRQNPLPKMKMYTCATASSRL